MSLISAHEMAQHRADAEAMMLCTFEAYAPSDAGPARDADGYDVPTFTPRGRSIGKIQANANRGGDTQTRTVRVGGVERPVVQGGLHLPVGAYVDAGGTLQLKPGWEFVCTEVAPPADPSQKGRRWLVVEVPVKDLATARRLDVAEIPA